MQESSTTTPLNTPVAPSTSSETLDSPVEDRPTPSNERVLESSDASQTPVSYSTYRDESGRHYSVDYFNIQDVFELPENPLDKYNLRENILLIEDHVLSEMEQRSLKDTTDTYRYIVEHILDEIGRTQYEEPPATISRIGNYITYLSKMREAKRLEVKFRHGTN